MAWLSLLLCVFISINSPAFGATADEPTDSGDAEPSIEARAEVISPSDLITAPLEEVSAEVVPLTEPELAKLAQQIQKEAKARTRDLVEQRKIDPLAGIENASDAEIDRRRERQKQALLDDLDRRTEAFDRLEIVLSEWEEKGGDPKQIDSYRAYRRAVLADTIDKASIRGLAILAWTWIKSPDGGLKILGGVGILVAAFAAVLFFASIVRSLARRQLAHSSKASKLLQAFLVFLIYWAVVIIGLGIAISMLGLDLAPFLAIFGGISFIVAFALQETLGNFAAGLMILAYRPFDRGERVIAAGVDGHVQRLTLTSTIISTPDNRLVTVPNSKVWNDVIINTHDLPKRRVDLEFLLASPDDALALLNELPDKLKSHPDVLKEPAPELYIGAFDGRGATLQVRPWVESKNYWPALRSVTRLVMSHIDERGMHLWQPREWNQSPV